MDVLITVKKITVHNDLIEQYENPIEHACDMQEDMTFVSKNGKRPLNFCTSAWKTVRYFVQKLAKGA